MRRAGYQQDGNLDSSSPAVEDGALQYLKAGARRSPTRRSAQASLPVQSEVELDQDAAMAYLKDKARQSTAWTFASAHVETEAQPQKTKAPLPEVLRGMRLSNAPKELIQSDKIPGASKPIPTRADMKEDSQRSVPSRARSASPPGHASLCQARAANPQQASPCRAQLGYPQRHQYPQQAAVSSSAAAGNTTLIPPELSAALAAVGVGVVTATTTPTPTTPITATVSPAPTKQESQQHQHFQQQCHQQQATQHSFLQTHQKSQLQQHTLHNPTKPPPANFYTSLTPSSPSRRRLPASPTPARRCLAARSPSPSERVPSSLRQEVPWTPSTMVHLKPHVGKQHSVPVPARSRGLPDCQSSPGNSWQPASDLVRHESPVTVRIRPPPAPAPATNLHDRSEGTPQPPSEKVEQAPQIMQQATADDSCIAKADAGRDDGFSSEKASAPFSLARVAAAAAARRLRNGATPMGRRLSPGDAHQLLG
eukprot:TRINITY_DN47411_c0_g1_i1.p1 TRINITY_DN47411_c0_g1~~TRINITY_DN47411_c0_g1_i1.p1  ORF type:complete len:480 (+),score=93.01 TRINITY_DN47411_c0_g1_i1:49-1488(+)